MTAERPKLFNAHADWHYATGEDNDQDCVLTIRTVRELNILSLSGEEMVYLKSVIEDALYRAGIDVPA